MHIKQRRILSIIIFVIMAFVFFKIGQIIARKQNISITKENVKVEKKIVDMSFVTENALSSISKYGTVEGVYPQFRNVDPSFNDKIKNTIVIAQSEFENNSKDNWNARRDTSLPQEQISEFPNAGDFVFSTDIKYFQVNSDYVSFLIIVSGFSGGAHGYESLYAFNYDVKNAKEINCQEFFTSDPDYLIKLSDYSRKDLLDQFTERLASYEFLNENDYKYALQNITEMIILGTEPNLENFSIFTLEPGFINLYFSQYQVAPYVYGSQIVKMPL